MRAVVVRLDGFVGGVGGVGVEGIEVGADVLDRREVLEAR